MIAIPSRHKSLTLLAGVIVAQVLLLAVQIKRERQVRLIRVWAVELISPVQRAVSWAIYGVEHGWGGYIGLRRAKQDNEALRAELDRLKMRNCGTRGPRPRSGPPGRSAQFSQCPFRSSHARRARDRRESGFRKPGRVY